MPSIGGDTMAKHKRPTEQWVARQDILSGGSCCVCGKDCPRSKVLCMACEKATKSGSLARHPIRYHWGRNLA